MRAAQAAKEANQGASPGDPASDDAGDVKTGHKASALDYFLDALPMLKPLLDELCSQEPSRRSLLLATRLLERLGAPASLVSEIEALKLPEKDVAYDPALVTKPPCAKTGDSPKKKAVKAPSAQSDELNGESEAAPNKGAPKTQARVSIWTAPQEDDDSPSESEESDHDDDDSANKRASQSRGSLLNRGGGRSSMAAAGGGKRGSQQTKNMSRRFTVHMTKQLVAVSREQGLDVFSRVPAFKGYSDEDLEKIFDIAVAQKFEPDEVLLSHGAVADEFHVIVEGSAKVSVPYQIGDAKPGDHFGDDALKLALTKNSAEVSACGDTVTSLMIRRKDFQSLDLKKGHMKRDDQTMNKVMRAQKGDQGKCMSEAKKRGWCEESNAPVLADYEQTKADRELITMAVGNNKIFDEILELSEQQRSLIADSVYMISVNAGETLTEEGSEGSIMYIVQEGLLNVESALHAAAKPVHLRCGDSFGELALMYNTPRSATVVAAKPCLLWVLTRADFKMVTQLVYTDRMRDYAELLGRIPAIRTAVKSDSNLDMLANVLEKVTFYDAEPLCIEGEDVGLLYIIYEGTCVVTKDGEFVRKLHPGDFIGEEQVMKNSLSEFTVEPEDHDARVSALLLDWSSLNTMLRALSEMAHSSKWGALRKGVKQLISQSRNDKSIEQIAMNIFADDFVQKKAMKQASKCPQLYDISSTRKLGVLGEGSFGSVILLESTVDPSQTYALKMLSKDHMAREGLITSVQSERNILMLINSDFVVRLYRSYQDPLCIFFLLECVLNGELFDVVVDQNLLGRVDLSRFWIANVAQALQHIHMARVIYRDLKLENMLMCDNGYIKLTDMGIAKIVMGKTYTICGTSDYFAPETLRQSGHDRAVDWWAAGVSLFILVTGRAPFDAPNVTGIYRNIMKGFSKVTFPDNVPSDCEEVIKGLCRKKPEERITMQRGGVTTLMELPFFGPLDWEGIMNRTMEAPWKPEPANMDKILNRKLERDVDLNYETIQDWDGSLPKLSAAPAAEDSKGSAAPTGT